MSLRTGMHADHNRATPDQPSLKGLTCGFFCALSHAWKPPQSMQGSDNWGAAACPQAGVLTSLMNFSTRARLTLLPATR